MNAIELLAHQLDTVNVRLHHSAHDLTPVELVATPIPGENAVAFILWHMARSQDWAVNTAIRDGPEVITREPWSATALAVPGTGTGFALEEATRAARGFVLGELLAYADAVHADTLAWLDKVDEAILDSIPDVAAHDAMHPEYQTAGFRAEMDGGPEHDRAIGQKGGLAVWIFLTSVSIAHLHRHLGEVDMIKGLLRRQVSG